MNNNKPVRIACIGASAGGLEALTELLKALPKNPEMAFVLIQHLEPQHKSALSEILSRETPLIVREAKNKMKVEPGGVYVIPPNALMAVRGGRLKLTSRVKRTDGRHLPVDFFMTSLAKDQGKRAVGVILSGTGSDGTLGAKAIKAAGGTVFAQSEKTARYFGMPGSVISEGSADHVLAPGEIARELARPGAQKLVGEPGPAAVHPGGQNGLNKVLVLLRDLTGVDFLHYKQTTIARRISRRMMFHGTGSYAAYFRYLTAHPEEADVLRKDILIPVTSFFREPQTFAALRKKVFPLLAVKRSPQNPVRLWVPACSTGEEVYSLAIALYEFMEEKRLKPYIQVFGTDLSEAVIEKARSGQYSADIAARVSPLRLRRFFTRTAAGYKIAKPIRDLCIFAKHDITSAVPLSNMDLVSCRNLLIYLDSFLQKKALSTLHYALKPSGFLVLGAAESVSSVPDLFTALDKRTKIYSKNVAGRQRAAARAAAAPFAAGQLDHAKTKKAPAGARAPARREKAPARPEEFLAKAGAGTADFTRAGIAKLRKEFARAVERLRAISEEKDTFNEELKAANEEIQSSNEELQSTNEELETSKEELQSTNEELLTLNEELQNKNAELAGLNSDLNNVFASTNLPLIIVGEDLRIKRFTPTARKVMNLIPADVGRPLGDIKLNFDIPGLEETILGVIEEMAPREEEVKDREGRWYSVRVRPYRTLDNKIDGALIALYDIDAMKRVQEASDSALEYVKALIDTVREPLVMLDENARVIFVNRSFLETFGLKAQETEHRPLYDLCGGQWNNPRLRDLIARILPEKSQFSDFEIAFALPKTGRRTMLLNGRQVRTQGNMAPMIMLAIEDITDRKKAGDIIKRDSEALEKLIAARSKELVDLQARLERAKRLSDVGTLAATIAHELRNTLGAISAAEYNIRKKALTPGIAGNLDTIVKKVSEGERIIGNVLSYSRIKTSSFEPVRINDLLELSAAEIKDRALAKGISVSAALERTGNITIEADPGQLNEVFSNILNNALDAVNKDGGAIAIESDTNGSALSVLFRDNGEGMAPEDLKKAMDPFFTTKAKGTGLGLAVCSQIIGLHGGRIELESEKGKGTAVRITLPLARRKHAEDPGDR